MDAGRRTALLLAGIVCLFPWRLPGATLGTTSSIVSATSGSDSVTLAVAPGEPAWAVTANAPWLHVGAGFASGTGSTNLIFTFDANPGAPRTGTLLVAGQTLTITQVSATHTLANAVTTLVGSGLSYPTALAVDSAGNAYVCDRNANAIRKWDVANNSTTTLVNSGLNLPNGIALDADGNIYIADSGNNAIKKWSIASASLSTIVGTGLSTPYGVAADAAGNVYIADSGNNAIKKWSVADSTITTLVSSNLSNPIGVAVDVAGNLYIADTLNGAVKKWSVANSNVTTLISGLSTPAGVAVDGAGNVYAANTFAHSVRKWSASTSNVTTIITSGLLNPNGVAVDATGNLYVANTGNANVRELPRAYVNLATQFLPANPGSAALPLVLPTSANLLAPFAPTSNQPWLTVAGASAGSLTVNFTLNTNLSRTANLAVLGLIVPVIQAELPHPEIGISISGGVDLVDGAATNNFGSSYVLASNVTTTFVITNSGTTNLTGLTLSIDGANPSDFIFGPLGLTDLAAGASTNFVVHFTPTALGSRSANLHVASNDANENPFDIVLLGTGIPPSFTLSPTNFHLGPLAGLTNVLLTVAPDFATWTATANSPWLHVDTPGGAGSTNILVTFDANPGPPRLGSLTIAGQTVTVNQAELPLPKIGVWETTGTTLTNGSSSIDFGAGLILATNATRTFVITNSGTASLTGIAITKSGANATDFILGAPGTTSLPPNGTTTFTLSFAPGATGARSADLHIASNDSAGNPFDINLTGVGVSPSFKLGTNNRLLEPVAGTGSVVLAVAPENAPWTASSHAAWVHLSAANQSGIGSANVLFNCDANPGITRTGTVTIAGQNLTVIQAAQGYDSVDLSIPIITNGLDAPYGVAVDGAGDVYVADSNHHAVKKWSAGNGVVSTLIGSGLSYPSGLALDQFGNLYLADTGNNAIKKWNTTNGAVTTIVSNGLSSPYGVTAAADGAVYIADTINNAVKKWSPTNNQVVTLLATGLASPFGVALDAAGNVYIADTYDSAIKKLSVGNGLVSPLIAAGLNYPYALAVDEAGNVYVADTENHAVKKWTAASGNTSLVVGNGLSAPAGVAVDAAGNLFCTDTAGGSVTMIPRALVNTNVHPVGFSAGSDSLSPILPTSTSLTGKLAPTSDQPWLTIVGVTNGAIFFSYAANPGPARAGTISVLGKTISVTQATLPFIATLGFTNRAVGPSAGSDSVMLRLIPGATSNWTASADSPWLHLSPQSQSGNVSTTILYNFDANFGVTRTATLTIAGQSLAITQAGSNYAPANLLTPLATAGLSLPHGVAVDRSGNMFILDTYNGALKRWSPANNTVTTLISSGLSIAYGVAVDRDGNAYIADTYNSAIKKWVAATGAVTNLVTTGLSLPFGVAVDEFGNVFIADTYNAAIKRWSVTNQTVSTLVATGLNLPGGVAVDLLGNVYIADTYNYAVKKWTAADGLTTTLVGAGLNLPTTVAVDGGGNVFIADHNNYAIKQWVATSNTVVPVVTSGLNLPQTVTLDELGNVYIADTYNSAIREWPRAFVDQTPIVVGNQAAVVARATVLPTTENLLPPFAPASNQPWLSILNATNGIVNFAVTANAGPARSASLSMLGKSIPVTQTLVITAPQLTPSKVAGQFLLTFAANAGQPYWIESAPTVNGPWSTATTLTGNFSGILSYTNAVTNSGNRFFRTRTP